MGLIRDLLGLYVAELFGTAVVLLAAILTISPAQYTTVPTYIVYLTFGLSILPPALVSSAFPQPSTFKGTPPSSLAISFIYAMITAPLSGIYFFMPLVDSVLATVFLAALTGVIVLIFTEHLTTTLRTLRNMTYLRPTDNRE